MHTNKQPLNPMMRPAVEPAWWNERHTTAWDHVRDAFQRDWDQTKADFSVTRGRDLNQTGMDTLKQATGKETVPPGTVKTHRDTPEHATKLHERVSEAQARDSDLIATAQSEIRRSKDVLRETILDTRGDAQDEKDALARKSLQSLPLEPGMVVPSIGTINPATRASERVDERADDRIGVAQKQSDHRVDKETEVIHKASADRDAALSRWLEVEPAARYGFGARGHYPEPHTWTEKMEEKLREEWTTLANATPWEAAKKDVQRGWDYASKKAETLASSKKKGAGHSNQH